MDYRTLFIDSFTLHQQLVNVIAEAKDEDGFAKISQTEMAAKVGRSQTWVSSAIKRINTEDLCIEFVAEGKYLLRYEDLSKRGVFSKILILMSDTISNPSMFLKKDLEIANEYGLKIKTVQMYKTYLRTGWKVTSKDNEKLPMNGV